MFLKHLIVGIGIAAVIVAMIFKGRDDKQNYHELTHKNSARIVYKLMLEREHITNTKYTEEQYAFVILHPREALRMGKAFMPKGNIINPKLTVENDYTRFRKLMADKESTNNWKAVNQFGYIGLFQFGKPALEDCGVSIDSKSFKTDPSIFDEDLQLETFDKWTKILYRYTETYISKYNGKTIHGIKVTTSGIIAGAHLVGHGNIKRWLNGEEGIKDGNGVDVSEYVELFAGYDITSHLNGSDELLAMN